MLTTERLRMEPWHPDDWMEFRGIATDPEMMRFISGGRPWTDEEVRRFADKQITRYAEDRYCRWKLVRKEGGPMIGFCGAGLLDGFDRPEIGWWVAREFWGQGIASEAAPVARRDLRERVGLTRIISVAHHENSKSIRIMQKIGLRFERTAELRGYPVVVYAEGG